MLKSRLQDTLSLLNGFNKITNSYIKLKTGDLNSFKQTSSNVNDLKEFLGSVDKFDFIQNPAKYGILFQSDLFRQQKRSYSAIYKIHYRSYSSDRKPTVRRVAVKLNESSRESSVPSTRISRLINFGNLAAGLGVGALNEMAKRAMRGGTEVDGGQSAKSLINETTSVFLTEDNIERIVNTLCKVRGAALKLGQMLSLQDEAFISPTLQRIFDRVRQSADFMPFKQAESVLRSGLGDAYRQHFEQFDEKPFAAASIGQVHYGTLKDSQTPVAVKVQYPGVEQSIKSDIDNLMSLLSVANLLPPGLYVENVIKHVKIELFNECDYKREAECNKQFADLLKDDSVFYVPKVYDTISSKHVLVTEFVNGVPLDKCQELDQETRNYIGENMLRLCLSELFEWNYMQTDPNWSNFLYDAETRKINLIDFGASRSYSKTFVDKYIRIIRAAANNDRNEIVRWSRETGFLTGYETKEAHTNAVLILGRAFEADPAYDFSVQDTTKRINNLIPTMLKDRLTPPPEETYSLHRDTELST